MTFAYLFGYPDYVVMMNRSLDVETHTHHAIQITLALDNPIQLTTDSLSITGMGVCIANDLPHQLNSNGGAIINYLVHPESALGLSLQDSLFYETSVGLLDKVPLPGEFDWDTAMCATMQTEAMRLWSHLMTNKAHPLQLDTRIIHAFQYINSLSYMKISAKTLADLVHLSPSHFMYLFRENTGIALRRYLLWRRLLLAFEAIVRGESFTRAAHSTGFSDSAHLSRTFKQMFGITLQTAFTSDTHVFLCNDMEAYNPHIS